MQMIKSNIGLGVVGGFVILLSVVMWNLGSKHGENRSSISTNKLLKSMSDTMTQWRDKDGKNNAKIASIQAERNELLDIIDKRDSTVRELLLNPKVKSAGKIKSETKFDTILVADTVQHDWNLFSFDNNWVSADISVKRDTMKINQLVVRNELIYSHEEEKDKIVVHVKQQNPYTQTTYIKDYVIDKPIAKKNKWLKNLLIGLGVGVIAGSLVH